MTQLRDYLRRFWFEFDEPADAPPGARLGCGVTALGRDDAERLIRDGFRRDLPRVRRVVEDVDIRSLDEGHVLPNMGDVSVRGVWFPRGVPPPGR